MIRQTPPSQVPAQMAQHFLHLLDDVNRTQGLFLEEISTLRARIQELESTPAEPPSLSAIHGCAVYLETPEGFIQGWSCGAQDLYGYSVEEVIGRSVDMFLPENLRDSPRTARSGTGCLRIRKDGHLIHVVSQETTIQDASGCVLGRLWLELRTDPDGPFVGGLS